MYGINITIREENKKLMGTIEAKNKYKNFSEKEKNKKRKYQRERFHINTDLNKRYKQYQRNYYASKKIRK